MTASWKIKAILKKRHMTIAALAEQVGMSRQNLNNKLSRDNFSEKELAQLAEALGCTVEVVFTDLSDGEKL